MNNEDSLGGGVTQAGLMQDVLDMLLRAGDDFW